MSLKVPVEGPLSPVVISGTLNGCLGRTLDRNCDISLGHTPIPGNLVQRYKAVSGNSVYSQCRSNGIGAKGEFGGFSLLLPVCPFPFSVSISFQHFQRSADR